MKRAAALLIAVFMMLVPFAADVYAAKATGKTSSSGIEKDLILGITDFKGKIEVKKPMKTYSQQNFDKFYDEVYEVLEGLMVDKRFFYVTDDVSCSGKYHDGTATVYVTMHYNCTKNQYSANKKKFDKALGEMMAGMDKKWTDVQKAAYLHDKLALNTTYLIRGSGRYTGTTYSALVEKKALCAGYARTYSLLLNEAGIENRYIVGDATNNRGTDSHAWNLVKIGKSWYHVDCTYDDADTTTDGKKYPYYVQHEYFLKSDKALTRHSNYEKGIAKSTLYDKMDWDSYSRFAYYGSGIIYYSDGAIKSFNTKTNKVSKLLSAKDNWIIDTKKGTMYYDKSFCTLVYRKKMIYYNLAHSVYRYDPKTGKVKAIYTNTKSDDMIIAIYEKDNKLYGTFEDFYNHTKECVIPD